MGRSNRAHMNATALFLVGCGGFLGAIARSLVALLVAGRLGTAWPWGTFIINVSGCFAISFFMTIATERVVGMHEGWRWFRPCILHSIRQCTAPCNFRVTRHEYRKQIRRLCLVLEGKKERLLKRMEKEMADLVCRCHAQNLGFGHFSCSQCLN